jgi:hypothetical protein
MLTTRPLTVVLTLVASLLLPISSHAFVSKKQPKNAGVSPPVSQPAQSCGGHYASERCPENSKIKPDLEAANRERDQLKRAKSVPKEIIGASQP